MSPSPSTVNQVKKVTIDMSDNATTAENPTAEVAGKAPVTFEVEEFRDGPFKGFKFTHPEYNSLGATVDAFGEATILALINSGVLARIRTKVKNSLPKDLKPAEIASKQAELLTKYPTGVLFSEEDAGKWRPEVRELTPNQLFKRAKEQFALGTPDGLAEGQRLLLEMAKSMQG